MMIVGLAMIIAAVVISFIFYRQMRDEQDKSSSLKAETDKVSFQEINIRKEAKDVKDEKEAFNKELQNQSGRVQQIHENIAGIKNVEKVLSEQLSEKDKTLMGLKNMLNSITRKQSGLDEELKKAKLDYMAVAERVDYFRKEKKGLEESVRTYIAPPQGVELKKIVVKVTPPVEGEIVEVNREYSFAVIDMGLEDDMRSGNILAIYRNDEFMAKAVVENVYKEMSSIIVLDEWRDVGLAPGDIARLLKP